MKKINLFSRLWSSGGNSQRNDSRHDCRRSDLRRSPSGFNSKLMLKLVSVLVLILTIGVGSAWGTTYTYTPGGTYSVSGGTSSISGVQWTYSSATYCSLNSSKIQIGSKNNPQTSNWTIQTAISNFGSGKKVTAISLTAYTTATTATYDISAGGASVKSGSLTTSSNTYSASNLNVTSGNIVITMKGSNSSKAMYLCGISVTYEDAASCTTPPTVTASSNSSVTATTATVSCSSGISSLGSAGCSISSYGFVIGGSANPAIGGSGVTKHEIGTSYTTINTSFSKNLTGLSPTTTYYVRPYATNGNGTAYGTQTSFTTASKGCEDKGASSITSSASTSYTTGPVDEYYKYSTRQILYTKSDLGLAEGKKGTIKSIYFKYAGSSAMSAKTSVDIYLANTSLTALASGTAVPYASFTKVYSGPLNFSAAGWQEFMFNVADFDYDGVGCLAVMIDDNSFAYDGTAYTFNVNSSTGAQIYKHSDSTNENPSTINWSSDVTATDQRPNAKFCIAETNMTQSTVNWYVNNTVTPAHSQTGYAGAALTGIPTPDESDCDGSKVFVGWYTSSYNHATNAPAFVSPTTIPEGGANYYAVFANSTPTNNYEQITAEGDLTAGAKYLIVGNNSTAYKALPVDAATSLTSVSPSGSPLTISSPGATLIWTLEGSADAWKIKSTSNNKYLQISGGNLTFETSTSLTFSVGVSSSVFTFTSSAASGNKILSYYHSQSKFNAYSSANTVYVFKQKITYTNYATSCCTPLGSVSGTLSSSTPTSATLTWSAVSGAEKYQVKVVGSSSHNDWTDAVSGVEVTGLTCNTAYTAYLRAIDTNGTNCSTGPESTVAIPAKSWTVTSTGVTNVTPASAIPSTTCDGFSIASMSPDAGYHLPANITVTNADHTWNSSTGALTISNVEGNVTITITGEQNSCTHYSFHWGTTKGSEDHVTCLNYVTGTTDTYRSALWTVPTTGGWTYVGWQGGWHNDNAKSANLGMTSIPYDKNHSKTLSRAEAGNVGGAQGYIQVYANSGDANKYVGFLPAGYIVRILNSSSVLQSTKTMVSKNGEVDDNNWHTSDIFELTSDIINGKYDVDLKTADGYVWAEGRSSTSNVAGMKIKNGNGTYRATNIVVGDAGTRGRFAIYADSGDDNWYCHFVPYHRIVFHANWPVSGSPADTYSVDVSVEETNSSIALASAPAAPTGYTFAGWYTAADGGTQRTGAQTISAGASADVELYAHWTANTYDITGSLTNVTCAALPTTYTYTGSAASESFTLVASTGYILPNSITVEMGSTTLTANTHYTYSSATGIVQITTTITDDIEITAAGVQADTYIDAIWNIVTAPKTGTYTRPTIADQTPGGLTDCQHLHYHFVGWITKAKYDAGTTIDARTTPTGDLVAGGSVTANGSTYYAVWEKENGVVSNDYELVTSSSAALADGDQIIIATSGEAGEAKAMGYSRGNNRAAVDVTIASGPKIENPTLATLSSDQDYIYPLQLVANSTFFNIKDKVNDKYLAATGNTSNNYLNLLTDGDDNRAKFTISVAADGVATITANITGTNIRNKMKYNSGNNPPIISCYNSGQSAVYIYRKPGVAFTDPIASCGEEYTITIDKNNASATCTSCGAKVTENATTLSNLVAPTWSGHQVDYYMIASADNSTKIAEADGTLAKGVASWTDGDGKWIKDDDATIYAKWKYAEYEIAYYDQGGSAFSGVHGADHPTTHTYNTATTLVNPTKNGYTFAGWYTSSDCSTGLVTTLGATAYTSGPINLYAKWTLKTYTVTWVVNGSTVATQTSVTYGTAYEDLSSTPSDPADNALSSCGSDRFVGWVTAEYTAEGGTKVAQYDPYAVTNSTVIDDTHHTFYAMFAKESGTAFSLSVTSGDFKISGLVGGVNYYATGALSGGKYAVTTTANSGDDFTFTKVSDGVYTIKHNRSNKFVTWSSSTNFGEADASINWTISSASHGSWSVVPATAPTRAFIMWYSSTNPESNSVFKPYATSNVTGTPDQYYYVEIGTSNLINYRTGCCSEKITLTVSDATSGAGGTVSMKWNTVSKSSGDQVSTCSEGTLNVEVTANPSYTLTAITIAGTNKTITLDPSDLTTDLPSSTMMSYAVTVPALATGTLTITPTFTRTYSVTYNLDGGETAGNTDVANYQSGATVTLVTPSPEKSGYNFAGWDIRDASSNVVTETSGHFTMPASNVTVTATWTAKPLTSISVTPATATVYVGQYVELPVTYDPADILTKGYTLVSTPSWCVTTGSTNTTLKITGGRGGATITEDKVETVSIKASADNTKTASVTVTVKPLPVDHFVDLIHGETFDDHAATIVDNNLSTAYSAPGHADVDAPLVGNDCEKQNLHLVGWIESEWANTHLTATMSEFIAAEDDEHNPLFFATYAPMNVSGKTYYAVWAKEKE